MCLPRPTQSLPVAWRVTGAIRLALGKLYGVFLQLLAWMWDVKSLLVRSLLLLILVCFAWSLLSASVGWISTASGWIFYLVGSSFSLLSKGRPCEASLLGAVGTRMGSLF